MISQKVVLITGCGHGLGLYTAQKLVSSGFIVFAGIRNWDDKDSVLKFCNYSSNLYIIKMDMTKYDEIDAAINEIISNFGKIDILINNAGSVILGPIDALSANELENLFKVNFFSMVYLTQKILPFMRRRNEGQIIIIGSISGVESSSYLGAYSATKFAVEAAVDCWATTLHKWNIKIVLLEPGAMNTNIPNSLTVGSYYDTHDFNPYKQLHTNTRRFLSEILNQACNPTEVAQLILDIIRDPNPKLRYQTSEFARNLVAKHLIDPQKTAWINEHREFFEKMSTIPADFPRASGEEFTKNSPDSSRKAGTAEAITGSIKS